MRTILLLITILGIGLGLLGWGGTLAWRQQQMLGAFTPATAQVTQVRVLSTGMNRHRPVIDYAYQARGRTWESDRLAPLTLAGRHDWAQQIAHAYTPGQSITIYLNPHKPASSYLLPLASGWPYLLIVMGIGCLGWACILLRAGGLVLSPPLAQARSAYGWFYLRAGAQWDQQAMEHLLLALLWYSGGLLVGAHCLWMTGGHLAPAAWLILLVYLAAGVLPMKRARACYRLARALGPATLSTTLEQAVLNQPVIVRVTLPIHKDIAVRDLRLALVCRRITPLGQEPIFVQSTSLVKPTTLHGGDPLCAEACFEVPRTKRRASGRFDRFAPSRIAWSLELTAWPDHCAKGTVRFPLDTIADQANAPLHSAASIAPLAQPAIG